MKGYVAKEAECPFYHKEEASSIYCEGVDERTTIKLLFQTADEKKRYRKFFCCKEYKKCLLSQMLYGKYEEDDDE